MSSSYYISRRFPPNVFRVSSSFTLRVSFGVGSLILFIFSQREKFTTGENGRLFPPHFRARGNDQCR